MPTEYTALWVNSLLDGTLHGKESITPCPPGELGMPWTPRVRTHSIGYWPKLVQPPGFNTFNSNFATGSPPSANFTYQRLNLVADAAILNKIRDQKLDLGVTLGEARETINLALDLAEDLVSVIKWVKKGVRHPGQFVNYMLTKPSGRPNLRGKPHWTKYEIEQSQRLTQAKKDKMPLWKQQQELRKLDKKTLKSMGLLSHAAANRWLQIRYGCTPAYNDLLKILEECRTGRANELDNLVSARVTIPFKPGTYAGSSALRPAVIDDKFEGKCFQQIKVWFKVSDPKARDLVQRGLHPIQLTSVLYELTPFSFMLDWLLPVGDTLASLASTIGITFVCGYRSMRSEVKVRTANVQTGTGFKFSQTDEDRATHVIGAYHRLPLTKFPSIIQVPTVENPYGIHTGQRITDTVAILHQLATGSRHHR